MTTPTAEIDLDELLRELAGSRGIIGRARLLARHWRQLRGLSDEQRERVALTLGTEAAGRQLERLFLRDGVLSEDERAVTEALDRLGDADPAELRELVESLREGDSRETGRRLLAALEAALAEAPEGPAAGSLPSEGAEPPPESPPLEAEPSKPAPESAPREAGPPGPEGASASRGAESPAPGAASAPPEAEPSRPAASPLPGVEFPQRDSHAVERGEHLPELEPGSRPPGPDAADPEPSGGKTRGEGARGEAADLPWAGRVPRVRDPERKSPATRAAVPDLDTLQRPRPALPAVERLRRLRRLHRDPGHIEALGPEGRAALRARMGDGWAARRCVSAMIRSGHLNGLDEAMALIESLHSPTAVTWCLADLIAAGGLDEPGLRRVLAAAPSPAARRRLERRAARRRDIGRLSIRP